MELPKISASEGVLGNLKDRFGIGKKKADDAYDEFDDYDESEDAGYDGYEDDPYGYDEPIGNHARSSSRMSPNLVSYNDVREHGVPRDSRDSRDSRADADDSVYGARHSAQRPAAEAPRQSGYAQQGSGPSFSSPFQQLDQMPEFQSKGLNSLFDSTEPPAVTQELEPVPAASGLYGQQAVYGAAQAEPAPAAASGYSAQGGGSADPYDVFAGNASSLRTPRRQLVVLRPVSYDEVEQVAKALRAGDAVVLALRSTRDDLAKRILDFSFGAASIAGARVDSIGIKTFAISATELTDAELRQLVSQGVL